MTQTRKPSSTGTPALPLLIHSVCGSKMEKTFSAWGMLSPRMTRRRVWSICRSACVMKSLQGNAGLLGDRFQQ
jgi:hypothetical protein